MIESEGGEGGSLLSKLEFFSRIGSFDMRSKQ